MRRAPLNRVDLLQALALGDVQSSLIIAEQLGLVCELKSLCYSCKWYES